MAEVAPSLAALSLDFNLAPVKYLHDSWYAVLPRGEFCRRLLGHGRARAHVSRYLLESLGLERRFHDDFSEPRSRLALLEPRLLETLFLYVGGALRSAEFRRELNGTRVALLNRALGSNLLDYATKRVPFAGPVPEFTYEPEMRDNPRLRLIRIGAVYSMSPRAAADPAYVGRVVLKLPHPISIDLISDVAREAVEPDNPGLPIVTRRVVREFLPKWLPLFD